MRRLLIVAALLILLPGMSEAQSCDGCGISFRPASVSSAGGTMTGPLLLPNGTIAAPSLGFSAEAGIGLYRVGAYRLGIVNASALVAEFNFTGNSAFRMTRDDSSIELGASSDVKLFRDAANTLALRNGTNAQQLNVYNSFTTYGSNYGMFSIVASATGTDLVGTGAGATAATGGLRSIQGSKSKTLTDAAAAVSFARVAVATNASAGGTVLWSAMSTNGTEPLTQVGSTYFAGVNTAGTVTCTVGAVGTPITAYSRVNTLACTISAVTSTTNCDLQVTCTDNLAGDQTPVFSWRLDMPVVNAVVVQ